MQYSEFLKNKKIIDPMTGIKCDIDTPSFLFDHQGDIVKWALKRGRAAIFAGTGLGKTAMELVWSDKVSKYTKKPVLVFAPLAVAQQHVREGNKFGVNCRIVSEQSECIDGVNVTNYHKMDRFDLSQFGGIVLDESSILKNTVGHYRNKLIDECKDVPFRLAATATPAPNDFMELGNHAEFLGVMSYTDMLSMFFTHDGGETQKWKLKGHAEHDFWRWMASWAVMMQKPSDLGYNNDGYDLPPLNQIQHTVSAHYEPSIETGLLFPMAATSLSERISARRDTVADRVAKAVSITPDDKPFVWWTNLNSEADMLDKLIPDAVNLSGSDKDTVKEQKLIDFSEGRIRVLITKPSLAGFGMNWQHCADTGFVGLNDSFEQIYQAIRRFYRFGQTNPVNVHFISSEIEGAVVANLRRKENDANRMAAAMIMHMSDFSSREVRGSVRDKADYNPELEMNIPNWIK